MGKQTTVDDSVKRAALRLLMKGLVTHSEAARLAGVSRQLMRYWGAQIDYEKARNAFISKIWDQELRRQRR
jgi:transposase-like protein